MPRFDSYFLMNTGDVIEYAREKLDLFNESGILSCQEIGDGNLNYVFRVLDAGRGRSVIVKQAGEQLRISKDFNISTDRNRIEVEMLRLEEKLCPGLVPRIFLYDPVMKCYSMEDLSDHQVMRTALLKHEMFPHFAEDISTFLVKTLLLTTDRILDSKEKKELVKNFINPELCADITEPLVYTEPYINNLDRNIVLPQNMEFVKKELYQDGALHLEIAKLKYDFMNNAQSLVHGDLHTGSIFIKKGSTKVMDPEFAFYGPMGYDIGNIIANMIFAWVNADAAMQTGREKDEYVGWVENTITDIVDLFKKKYDETFDLHVTEPMARTPGYKEYFLKTILRDSSGVVGVELLRRSVGLAQVKDLTSIADLNKRIRAERLVIRAAKKFIKNRESFFDGPQFIDCVKKTALEV
jgi:5-methylthioribose kinase